MANSLKCCASEILLLLANIREKQQFPNGIDGPELQQVSGLSVDDINDAVSLLKDAGYVETVLFMETRDFVFTTVKITPRGRVEAERISLPVGDPINLIDAMVPSNSGKEISPAEELRDLAMQMDALKSKFVNGNSELFLRTEDQAVFNRLYLESTAILDEEFATPNQHSNSLVLAVKRKSGGFIGGPSLACIAESAEILRAAARQLVRKALAAKPLPGTLPYVDPGRLGSLGSISGAAFDPARLIRLCEELNIASQYKCAMTVAILVRAITDHVPPVFGQRSFAEVANNYQGAKSFKKSMQHLELSLRNIADAHLHMQIRPTEALPNMTQVNFCADLDVLLCEVDRLLRASA